MKWSSINYLKIDFFKNPALILFCLASLTYILAGVLEKELLSLISTSLIIPSILLYYLLSCKVIEKIVVLLFVIFFIADIILLTSPENSLYWIIILYNLSYLILLYSVVKNIKKEMLISITKTKIYNIVLLLFIYLSVYFHFLDFIFISKFEYKPLYVIGSFLLLINFSLVSISFFLKQTLKKLLLLIALLMIIFSDVIYVFQIYYIEIESLKFWKLVTQSASYFFLINYYLIKNKKAAI